MSISSFPIPPVDLFNEPAFRFGVFHARPAVREIEMNQYVERLEPRVFQVLVVLARSRNRTISRDALIAQCWNGRFVSDDALNRTIGKLRRMFARDPSRSVTIETVPRVGYQLRVNSAGEASSATGSLGGGDDFRVGGGDPCCCGALDDPRLAVGTGAPVSEILREAGRILGQALHAIETSAGRGGSQLRLTIEMTTPDYGVWNGPSTAPDGPVSGLARYKERSSR